MCSHRRFTTIAPTARTGAMAGATCKDPARATVTAITARAIHPCHRCITSQKAAALSAMTVDTKADANAMKW